jgi:hypothetical protein
MGLLLIRLLWLIVLYMVYCDENDIFYFLFSWDVNFRVKRVQM